MSRGFKISLIAIIFGSLFSCSTQKHEIGKGNIDTLIKKLNWESFSISYSYVPRLYLRSDAKKIIALKSKKTIKKLIDNIAIPEKTVVIHVILTDMIEQKKWAFGLMYHYNGDTIDYSTPFFRELSWQPKKGEKDGSSEISPEEIQKVSKYWHSKLYKHE